LLDPNIKYHDEMTATREALIEKWFHHEAGESLKELREVLEPLRGEPVAVGEYPPRLEDGLNVICAYVPEKDGSVRVGVY
jgi:hypothetical protein